MTTLSLILLGLAIAADPAPEPAWEVTDIAGAMVQLEAPRIPKELILSGRAEGKSWSRPLADVLSIRLPSKPKGDRPNLPRIVLPTGEILFAEIVGSDGDALAVKNASLGELRLPLSAVRAIDLDQGRSEDSARTLDPGPAGGGDRLYLRNGDLLIGTFEGIGPEKIRFRQKESAEIARDLITGIVFDPSLLDYRAPRELFLDVQFSDHSRLFLRPAPTEVGTLRGTLGWGAPATIDSAAVSELSVRNGSIVYLSDLEPSGTELLPFADDAMPLARDRNVVLGPLVLAGKTYAKGLGMKSRTVARFSCAGFRRFEALVGLDDSAGPLASARFRIRVGSSEKFDSGLMVAGAKPRPVSVELEGASEVTLEVDYGHRGDVRDFADWCLARLVR